jgi:hypothetical protein
MFLFILSHILDRNVLILVWFDGMTRENTQVVTVVLTKF